ncbi:MAG TPA: Calx-beta domain-containing protein, partial [Pyrinomonadaceae bacterium]|nr:Calx-beta domain-containing protein [Pyrinomonadaceae bacterium]
GWTYQTFHDSRGFTDARFSKAQAHTGAGSLAVAAALIGGDPNRAKGEVYADLKNHPPPGVSAPLNLANVTARCWVLLPPGSAGNPQAPNGVQLIFKSEGFFSLYSPFQNIRPEWEGKWVEFTANASGPAGFVDSQYDPTKVIEIGLKVSINDASAATLKGTVFLDDFKLETNPPVAFDFERLEVERDFAAIEAACGGCPARAVRVFVFADGRAAPDFAADGSVAGFDENFFEDFDAMVAAAAQHNLMLIPVLLDFSWFDTPKVESGVQEGGHSDVIRDAAKRQTFLDRAVKPLAERYHDSPNIYAWEVVNEPEWAMQGVSTGFHVGDPVTVAEMQEFARLCAQTIHASASQKVTVGSARRTWLSFWKRLGLDLYQFHWYDHFEQFQPPDSFPWGPASELGLDKPCLVGEVPTSGTRRSTNEFLNAAFFGGYQGLLAWSYRAGDNRSSFAGSAPVLKSWCQAAPCTQLYNAGGWVIEACPDPSVSTPMEVRVGGFARGTAARVSIYHKSQNSPGTPQVAVLYSSGFVRLKQNDDPTTPIPFGSSFVLGPAYWAGPSSYFHNPQLKRLDIDAALLPDGALRLTAAGANGKFDVSYEMLLPPPLDRQTRLHVAQEYRASASVQIDPTRRAESQGFKLVQVSSMFINKGGTCDGGHTDCRDSDGARYVAADGLTREVSFPSLTPSTFIFKQTAPLGARFLDVLHGDDQGWQGNTPNVRVELDALPQGRTVTPQGFITATTDPNNDNVGVWLHDDGAASQSWAAGQSDRVGYWLIAQDNPPEARSEPTIQFSAEGQAVDESAGSAAVAVTRAGDASGAATIDYATLNATASERSDYTRASGTLRFAPGEVSKSFNVFVTHDAFNEEAETVNLVLSNPTGAAYGQPAAATLTINNVASQLPGNPADDSQFFVRQHYHDFLNREPDASGLQFWTNEIEKCGADSQCREVKRVNVSAAFFLSIEFQQTGYLVYRFHQAAFNAGPSLGLRAFLSDTQEIGRGV